MKKANLLALAVPPVFAIFIFFVSACVARKFNARNNAQDSAQSRALGSGQERERFFSGWQFFSPNEFKKIADCRSAPFLPSLVVEEEKIEEFVGTRKTSELKGKIEALKTEYAFLTNANAPENSSVPDLIRIGLLNYDARKKALDLSLKIAQMEWAHTFFLHRYDRQSKCSQSLAELEQAFEQRKALWFRGRTSLFPDSKNPFEKVERPNHSVNDEFSWQTKHIQYALKIKSNPEESAKFWTYMALSWKIDTLRREIVHIAVPGLLIDREMTLMDRLVSQGFPLISPISAQARTVAILLEDLQTIDGTVESIAEGQSVAQEPTQCVQKTQKFIEAVGVQEHYNAHNETYKWLCRANPLGSRLSQDPTAIESYCEVNLPARICFVCSNITKNKGMPNLAEKLRASLEDCVQFFSEKETKRVLMSLVNPAMKSR